MILVVVSTGHFDPLIEACNDLSDRFDFLGQVGSSEVEAEFPHFKTCAPAELEGHMRAAELVITHAGTGMLSMLYRLGKKAVIIPKQMRYGEANDGQVELAQKWGQLGLGILCMDVDKLESAIQQCRSRSFQSPQFEALGQHLKQSLGAYLEPPSSV